MVVIQVSDRLELQAPYHPVLPHRSKQIGGLWLGAGIGWSFPHSQEEALRALCLDIWGVDGTRAAFEDTVEIKVTVDEQVPYRRVFEAAEQPIYLVGREIAASLRSRRGARPGRGVRFMSGNPRCIALPSIWLTTIPNGAVFLVRDVPISALDRFRDDIGGAGHVEVLGSP
ncbi:hypothetical protein [Acidisoma cladoniae]|uniref:hypothetical protein n=1 Tax=Acidisoma cladoniae TaxID=3040935 RepID=UPI0025500499|nr:hypothetical protein [Acidisoma sp. PAMC 29798]